MYELGGFIGGELRVVLQFGFPVKVIILTSTGLTCFISGEGAKQECGNGDQDLDDDDIRIEAHLML